jgi:hypothetical protein
MADKEIIIFYSWQSEVSKETNQHAIKAELRTACSEVEAAFGIKIILDEATRDAAGSPNIPIMVFEKISMCDIFICDITTVNQAAPAEFRRAANSNVLVELGYAVAEVGWERILMLFNKQFGDVKDAPFDIDRHRISAYKITDEKDNGGKKQLKELLVVAIQTILKQSPQKPFEKKKIDPAVVKKEQDIIQLKRVLSTINSHALDTFLEMAPQQIYTPIIHYFDGFKGIVNASNFMLYDPTALGLVEKVYKYFSISLTHDYLYVNTANSEIQKLGKYQAIPFTAKEKELIVELREAIAELNKNWRLLLKHIKLNYLEIDTEKLSKAAFEEYQEFRRSI